MSKQPHPRLRETVLARCENAAGRCTHLSLGSPFTDCPHEESASHTVGDTINDQSLTGSTDLTDIDSRQVEIETLAQKLRDSPNKVGLGLNTLAQTQQRVLLVVDQLEELFTLCPDQDERIKLVALVARRR